MKFYLLAFVLVYLCSTSVSNAQNTIGLRAGLNFSTFVYDLEDDEEDLVLDESLLTRYYVSVPYTVGLSKHFGLEAALNFTGRGGRSEFPEYDITTDITTIETTTTETNYIGLSLFPHYRGGSASFGFYVGAGLGFDYALSGRTTLDVLTTTSTATTSDTFTDDIDYENDNFRRTDLMLSIGGGLLVPVGERGNINLDVRYNGGLLDQNTQDNSSFTISNGGLLLGLGYLYRL